MSMAFWTFETEKAIDKGPKSIVEHLKYLINSVKNFLIILF